MVAFVELAFSYTLGLVHTKSKEASVAISFSIRMDEDLKQKLDLEAAAEDRSSSYIAHKAIEQFIDARIYRREVIMAAYNSSLTEEEFISGDAMTDWVESWGTEKELPEPTADIFK
jgi:predicted transcriptional regulator